MIQLVDLCLNAGKFRLDRLCCTIPTGSYAVLMGRSGQGKTTILESICGLRPVRSGSIRLGDRLVHNLPPGERGVGYVPQDLGLFPTMTVREHLDFALRLRRWSTIDCNQRVRELAELLGIGDLLGRNVRNLSGGEAQRVALGRALSFRPQVLLLDEPLSSLDEETRSQMHQLLVGVKQAMHTTTLHVTHSRDEAAALADVRLTLADGGIRVDTGE